MERIGVLLLVFGGVVSGFLSPIPRRHTRTTSRLNYEPDSFDPYDTGHDFQTTEDALRFMEKERIANGVKTIYDYYPDCELMNMKLEFHKPLGLRAEESYANKKEKFVFVSKVEKGGNADKAGIKVGDVITAVTGSMGWFPAQGLESVQQQVRSLSEMIPMEIQVARNTTVMEEHDQFLLSFAVQKGKEQKERDDTIFDILSFDPAFPKESSKQQKEPTEEDLRGEELVEQAFDIWNEELLFLGYRPTPEGMPAASLTGMMPSKKGTELLPKKKGTPVAGFGGGSRVPDVGMVPNFPGLVASPGKNPNREDSTAKPKKKARWTRPSSFSKMVKEHEEEPDNTPPVRGPGSPGYVDLDALYGV
mmetsp:Transcript_23067/g.53501  ORF Transcript_23067/g.53501 Transcript_23067/m.53501 type:complete len:362 (-) Transcript_23067:150-1235(-)